MTFLKYLWKVGGLTELSSSSSGTWWVAKQRTGRPWMKSTQGHHEASYREGGRGREGEGERG